MSIASPSSAATPSSAVTEAQDAATEALIAQAADHVDTILRQAFEHDGQRAALIVADHQCRLTRIVAAAYRRSLPSARFIDFDDVAPEVILAAFATLAPSDLVVLVQSTSFRLEAFRIRVELFKRGLKVIEHPHLARMLETEAGLYIDSLAYDQDYVRPTGFGLKAHIDKAAGGLIDSGGAILVLPKLEPAKLNVGDYREMKNVGGQFPIGEVFTEALDLEALEGKVRISSFGSADFCVRKPSHPITLVVEKGQVTAALDSTPEFDQILEDIRAEEGTVWVRELGFGLNRAFTQEKTVTDIGTYERMCGIHLSLGAKHMSYDKPQIRRNEAKYHVDVFVLTETFTLDDAVVYRDGAWQVGVPAR